MAWNSQYALDGFFLFGAPLNVTRYVIDPADNKFGQSTDSCWVARFELDDEIDVIARLNDLSRRSTIYPVVSLLRRSSASVGPEWVMEQKFYKAWIFSQGGNFSIREIPELQVEHKRFHSPLTRLTTVKSARPPDEPGP
jgi:hypothetical protein